MLAAQIGDRNPGLLFLQYSDDLVFGEPVALHLWSLSWGQSLLHTGSSQGGNVNIVKTIAIELTFTSLGLLGGLVLVRTFLSWTLALEIEGCWPWQRDRA
ncbi:DUF1622 domain-containing protein, partial [Pseudomonas sp. EA_65y_Pfl1_P113]|uniref:DUF1622 domain-containing protein n=1 Tax=Pseudomonas sp. EA_65y_Pfl1_P113 TaxID=3088692 RepID=UPI00351A498B